MSKVNYRREYSLLVKQLASSGKENPRVTLSDLILSVPINNKNNTYIFPVLETDASGVAQIPEEIRLNQNDLFSVLEMGIFYRAVVANNFPDAGNPSQASMWLTSVPTELNSDFLIYETLYEGQLQIKVNNVVWMDKWNVKKHQVKGVTQWQNSSVGLPYATQPSNRWENDGLQECIPKFNFSGARKNQPSLTIPTALDPLPTPMSIVTPQGVSAGDPAVNMSLSITHIVLHCKGFLAQNCADFQTKESAIRQQKKSVREKFAKRRK